MRIESSYIGPEIKNIDNRDLLNYMAYMHNELILIGEVILILDNEDHTTIEGKISRLRSMTMYKMMAGKIFEIWNFLKRYYIKQYFDIHKKTNMDEETISSLDTMIYYFSNPQNTVKKLRDKSSFHYERWELDFYDSDRFDLPEEFVISGSQRHNTHYYYSDYIMILNLIKAIDRNVTDFSSQLDKIMSEILDAHKHALCALDGVIGHILSQHLESKENFQFRDTVLARAIPNLKELRIPPFTIIDSS